MKAEIAFYLTRVGPAILVIGLSVMIGLSTRYSYPGSWNEMMATVENPLRGFWIVWSIFGAAMLGLLMWLVGLSLEEGSK